MPKYSYDISPFIHVICWTLFFFCCFSLSSSVYHFSVICVLKKNPLLSKAQINTCWFMEINTVLHLILNDIHIHLTQHKSQGKINIQSDLFTNRYVYFFFFSASVSLNASLKNTFLEPAFINMSQSYALQPRDVPSSEFIPSVYWLTFLLILTCSVCKFGRSAVAEWHFSSKVSSVDDLWLHQDTVVFYYTAGFYFCADEKMSWKMAGVFKGPRRDWKH